MSKYYKLTKLSSKGFELTTSDINMIFDVLDSYVCTSCTKTVSDVESYCDENSVSSQEREYMVEDAFPKDYDTLPVSEKIDWLMSTACGCEFMFKEFDSYHDYMVDKMEDVQYYFKRKQGKV